MTSTSFAQNKCFSSMLFLKSSSRSRSGGSEAECAVTSTNFAQKLCFSLSFFFSTGAHARDLEGSEAECVMTSTSFCINFSSRSRSGEVGSRMCDDVDKFCSKSMFFLDVFFEIELTLAIWKGQRQNV